MCVLIFDFKKRWCTSDHGALFALIALKCTRKMADAIETWYQFFFMFKIKPRGQMVV